MKTDIYLFYHVNYSAKDFFRIRNAELRNPNLFINSRPYIDDIGWKDFLRSFIKIHYQDIIDNGVDLTEEYEGFVLLYTDTTLNKKIIVLDTESIVQTIAK